MRVLALDTATEVCSAAVLAGEQMYSVSREVGRGHAEQILGMVDEVLARAQLELRALDAIVAGVGPGSFTGVRIGVSTAQGLAFGAALPMVAVTSLEALALQAVESGAQRVFACLDARMGELYWACFEASGAAGLLATSAPAVDAPGSIRLPWPLGCEGIGRGLSAYPALAAALGLRVAPGAERALPQARDMARLGARRLALGAAQDAGDIAPLYVRDKVAATEAERFAQSQNCHTRPL